jgi:hypothetical protein
VAGNFGKGLEGCTAVEETLWGDPDLMRFPVPLAEELSAGIDLFPPPLASRFSRECCDLAELFTNRGAERAEGSLLDAIGKYGDQELAAQFGVGWFPEVL